MDTRFQVVLDRDGSSTYPQQSIWRGQHICVSEDAKNAAPPDEDTCGDIIVKHQLKHGHWSVLEHAFVRMEVYGFPHSVMVQWRTHRALSVLSMSNRYTGNRFCKVYTHELDIEDVLYFRPIGFYADRAGNKYEYTEDQRETDKLEAYRACSQYANKVDRGFSFEHARGGMVYDTRQDWCFAAKIRDVLHTLDQRSLADTQLESRQAAYLIMEQLEHYIPEIAHFYKETRYGRNKLAP